MNLFERLKSDVKYLDQLRKIEIATKNIKPDSTQLLVNDIEASVDKYPNNLAFLFEGDELTYAEFEERANRFAHWGLELGLKAGHCVSLFMENKPDFVAFWFGMSKIGVVTALINNNLSGKSLAHCLQVVDTKLVVLSETEMPHWETAEAYLETKIPVWCLGSGLGKEANLNERLKYCSVERPDPSIRDNFRSKDVVLYIYTSGTTGLPKAAKMTNARCLEMMRAFRIPCKVGPEDRIYETLPLYHGTCGVCGVGCALTAGASVILRKKFSASTFWKEAKETQATMFVYVGELGRYLMNLPPSTEERDHSITKGFGNGMRKDTWEKFVKRTGVGGLVEFYGSTEGNVSFINLDQKIGAIGRVPPFLRGRIFSRILKMDLEIEQPIRGADGLCIEADIDEPGEAVAPILTDVARYRFEGYQDDKQTEKKILCDVFERGDRYFRTGDLLSQDKYGYMYFIDRLGDTFRWKSENVSTGEVENVISAVDGVLTANVYGVSVDGHDGKAGMVALTVTNEFDIKKLYDQIQVNLPQYAQPVFVRILQEEDITGNLKARKTGLVENGFDPKEVGSDLWVKDVSVEQYVQITDQLHNDILTGKMRL